MSNIPNQSLHETILAQEKKMWQSFANGDSQAFAQLVDPQALMIVGGGRVSGAAYSQDIAMVRLGEYELLDVAVLNLGPGAAAIHYTVKIKDYPGPYDLSGSYRVTSVWRKIEDRWVLVLNHDSVAAQFEENKEIRSK